MKKIFSTVKAPAAIGPYSQAVEMNNTIPLGALIEVDTIAMK